MSMMGSAGDAASKQLAGIKQIPGAVLNNWPAFFGFTTVDYITGMIMRVIPDAGGVLGTIETAALSGMLKVINHVTWEKLRST